MKSATLLFIAALANPIWAHGQTTLPSAPKTKLGAFHEQEGAVVIWGISTIGEIRAVSGTMITGTVTVVSLEVTNLESGKKESGISLSVENLISPRSTSTSLIDYDEIPPLIKGIEDIGKIEHPVTKLDKCSAEYRTKDNLRIFATCNSGKVDSVTVYSGWNNQITSVYLKASDLVKIRDLITTAKAKLDSTR